MCTCGEVVILKVALVKIILFPSSYKPAPVTDGASRNFDLELPRTNIWATK